MKTTALLALVLLPAAALAKGSGARAGIDAGNKGFEAAMDKGDAAAAAAVYTADAKVMPPNSDVVSGTKDIEALFAGFTKAGVKVGLETTDVFEGNRVATEVGKYTISDAKG